MKQFVRLVLVILPLVVLLGCGAGKPKPAELPQETIPLPKRGPLPSGRGKGSEAAQLRMPAADTATAAAQALRNALRSPTIF
jgi:hypothetical protein